MRLNANTGNSLRESDDRARKEEEIMTEETWIGPWCVHYVLIVRDKSIIVDEKHEYRRHVYVNGVFKTEKISVEKWWSLGYNYTQLPQGLIN